MGVYLMSEAKTQIIRVPGPPSEAEGQAMRMAMDTHREVCPVRVFTQGKREMVSGVLPIRVVTRLLKSLAAQKGSLADEALMANNRPVIKEHWMAIADYLKRSLDRDEPFIIPPLTLNSTGNVQIYVPDGQSTINTGYAILPDETSIHITDGQHRFLGIDKVATDTRGTPQGETFMSNSVPFLMTIESDTSQVHQDFADAGRTKSLPPSLLAVYDTRQPANGAVMSIIEGTPLLKGRVDATSNTVSKSTQFIFLVNQVRQFVKHSLTGLTGASETAFGEQADAAMTNRESRNRWVRSRVAFLKVMTEIVPDWNQIARLSQPGEADSATVLKKTREIKQQPNVTLHGAFLTTLGLLSYKVLDDITSADLEEERMMEQLRNVLKPLNGVDWSREGPLWNGNIVTGGKIRTQASAVRAASQKMLEHLGFVG